jgi:hypothetical protein
VIRRASFASRLTLCAPRYTWLFARGIREGWDCHGDEVPRSEPDDCDAADDFAKSINVAYEAVRERVASGGPTWTPKPVDDLGGIPDFLRRTQPEGYDLQR